MADTSAAIIISASITASVALGGVITTVLVGLRQPRKTLEHAAEQARQAREADDLRDEARRTARSYGRAKAMTSRCSTPPWYQTSSTSDATSNGRSANSISRDVLAPSQSSSGSSLQ